MDTFRPDAAIKRLEPLLRDIGRRVLTIQRSGQLSVRRKKAQYDVVTRADKLAEKMIASHIKKYYPDHCIHGEEITDVRHDSFYQWFIDPIDGTANFSRGHDLFGISVWLYKHGRGILGMIHFPALGKFTYAIKGRGAFLNGKRIRIKKTAEGLQDALVASDINHGKEYLFKRLRDRSRNLLCGGSFVAENLWLLEGKIDAFVHSGAQAHDLAAARIIVEEAGGVVSGIASKSIDMNAKKVPIILARSERLVRELRKVMNGK